MKIQEKSAPVSRVDVLRVVLGKMRPEMLPQGTVAVTKGMACTGLIYLVDGILAVSIPGQEECICTHASDAFSAQLAAIDDSNRWIGSVRFTQDSSVLFLRPHDLFQALMLMREQCTLFAQRAEDRNALVNENDSLRLALTDFVRNLGEPEAISRVLNPAIGSLERQLSDAHRINTAAIKKIGEQEQRIKEAEERESSLNRQLAGAVQKLRAIQQRYVPVQAQASFSADAIVVDETIAAVALEDNEPVDTKVGLTPPPEVQKMRLPEEEEEDELAEITPVSMKSADVDDDGTPLRRTMLGIQPRKR